MKIPLTARLALLSLLVASPISSALSGEWNAIVNGRSFHVNAAEDWNENNFGLGLEFQLETTSRWKKQLMVNGFRDSSNDMSYMVGAGIQRNLYATDRFHGFYVDAGVNAFLMTRQDVNNNRPFPGALPSLSIGNRDMGFNLTYLPKMAVERLYDAEMMDESISGIVFLQFKINVGRLILPD